MLASLQEGYLDAGFSYPLPVAELAALHQAVLRQNASPRWRTSNFGPSPAVAPYAYRCLAAWYSTLDPASKARALADMQRGLLSEANPPWAGCPAASRFLNVDPVSLWEGAAQRGFGASTACQLLRMTTAYVPITGQELLDLWQASGGQLPPQLKAAVDVAGAAFRQQSFLLGVRVRPDIPLDVLQSTDPLAVARSVIGEVALVWAPGHGIDLTPVMFGAPPDPQALAALGMFVLGQGGLVLPTIGDPVWTDIFGSLTQLLPQMQPLQGFGTTDALGVQPGTYPTTGLDVLDKTGDELAKDASTKSMDEALASAAQDSRLWVGVATVAAVAIAAIALAARPVADPARAR